MYAQKKSIDNVHIVRERDRQRFRELLAVLALGIPIGLFLLLFTWQNLEVIRLGHEATRLQKQRKQIENGNKALQFQLDRLTSLQSVEQKATALGFDADPRSGAGRDGGETRGPRTGDSPAIASRPDDDTPPIAGSCRSSRSWPHGRW